MSASPSFVRKLTGRRDPLPKLGLSVGCLWTDGIEGMRERKYPRVDDMTRWFLVLSSLV